jgi:hypothetical protein
LERGDEHALDHFSGRRPQVAQLSEEAGRHGEHEGGYDELQFTGLCVLHIYHTVRRLLGRITMNNDPNVLAARANRTRFSRTPNLCTPRSRRVLNTVRITPAHTGILRSMLNAKAVPNTDNKTMCLQTERERERENTVVYLLSNLQGCHQISRRALR